MRKGQKKRAVRIELIDRATKLAAMVEILKQRILAMNRRHPDPLLEASAISCGAARTGLLESAKLVDELPTSFVFPTPQPKRSVPQTGDRVSVAPKHLQRYLEFFEAPWLENMLVSKSSGYRTLCQLNCETLREAVFTANFLRVIQPPEPPESVAAEPEMPEQETVAAT